MYPPEGYDSVYIIDDTNRLIKLFKNAKQKDMKDKISHTYAIFSNQKVRLLYQVRVKIVLSSLPKLIFCDICRSNQSDGGSQREESKEAHSLHTI